MFLAREPRWSSNVGGDLLDERIAVVLPCYNEESRLAVGEFRRFLSDPHCVDLLFVNDGSRDATGARLNEIKQGWEGRVTVVNLPENRGKAEAVRTGMLHAIHTGYPVVGFWDADLATPLAAVLDFHRVLRDDPRVEWVFGARVRLLGRSIERQTARHYLGRVFATATSRVLDLPVYDTQCGAKLFRVKPDLGEILATPFTSRWIFDVELIARLIRARRESGLPQAEEIIYEYPLRDWQDVKGSKLKRSDFVRAALELAAIRREYFSPSSRPT